ncbi:MAG: SDR family NAD(P)-dependent oxidoreductase [Candidatus Binatia bacterium]|nr:SDR family NAD(P)-dependent oxidoreductase [Candidatus Binatia bacterium]
MSQRTAMVTGASRGIGKAIAVALAAAGYDVAITARTVREGEERAAEGLTSKPIGGSLDTTAAEIESHGRRAVSIPLDLLERESLVPAAQRALAALGHVDVLVNNAIFVGPGNHDRFLDIPPDILEKRLFANVTAQLLVTQPILAAMVDRGRGTILGITSGAGQRPPPAAPGEGGWAIAYGCSKGGFHRIAGHIAVEYGDRGIEALNLQPGLVATERVLASGGPVEWIAERGVPPALIGRVAAHVAGEPAGTFENGSTIEAQPFARNQGWLK